MWYILSTCLILLQCKSGGDGWRGLQGGRSPFPLPFSQGPDQHFCCHQFCGFDICFVSCAHKGAKPISFCWPQPKEESRSSEILVVTFGSKRLVSDFSLKALESTDPDWHLPVEMFLALIGPLHALKLTSSNFTSLLHDGKQFYTCLISLTGYVQMSLESRGNIWLYLQALFLGPLSAVEARKLSERMLKFLMLKLVFIAAVSGPGMPDIALWVSW